jgi:hypothetical protein
MARWVRGKAQSDGDGARGDEMASAEGGSPGLGRGGDLARLIAGCADFGLEQAEGLLRLVRGAVHRNDYGDLAAEARDDLAARGDVLLARFGPGARAHMEVLAGIAQRDRDIPGSG